MIEKPNVLITGAHGFIGRYVAAEFHRHGYQVIGIGHGEWIDWGKYGLVEWNQCAVTRDSLRKYGRKPSIIVHCAGGASVSYSIAHPSADFNLTVQTTSEVLEYIRLDSPNSKLIYLSSAAVYGQIESQPISEISSLRPVSPYGVHKQMAESLCQMYSQIFELRVAILRPFSIYGAGLNKQLLWDACKKFSAGKNDFFGTGDEVRDWLHVKDLARFIYLISQEQTNTCSILNAGSGKGVKVRDILRLVSEHFKMANGPSFSSSTKLGDPFAYISDVSKANRIGWSPEIELHHGVAEYVEWFKSCQ